MRFPMEQIIEGQGRTIQLSIGNDIVPNKPLCVSIHNVNENGDRIGVSPFNIDYWPDVENEIIEKVFVRAVDKAQARLDANPHLGLAHLTVIDDYAFPWKVYLREADGRAYWINDEGMLVSAARFSVGGFDTSYIIDVRDFDDVSEYNKESFEEIYQALGFTIWRGILGGHPAQQDPEDFPQFSGNPEVASVLVYKQGVTQIAMLRNGGHLMITDEADHHSDNLAYLEEDLAIISNDETGLLPLGIQLKHDAEKPENTNVLVGFRCPKCGAIDRFWITAIVQQEFSDNGVVDSGSNPTWTNESGCKCSACGHSGTVADFTNGGEA